MSDHPDLAVISVAAAGVLAGVLLSGLIVDRSPSRRLHASGMASDLGKYLMEALEKNAPSGIGQLLDRIPSRR
ncbi:MAG: hypothetical protein ACRCT8_04170 [Lacipirellulaceae bacterium]